MTIVDLLETEAAPLAGDGRELVSLVQLDVLYGVTKTQAVHSCASSHISVHLYDRQVVDEFFCIRHVGRC